MTTLQELLNSEMDLASLTALARQGLAWWLDELSGLLPPAWRERLSSRPRIWLEARPEGGWRVWKDGRPTEQPPPGAASSARIGLLAPVDAVLTREIPTPRLPARDVRRMLTLDIDRLSPLNPDLIHFDMEILDRGEADGRQRVLLGLIPRAEAEALVERARRDGLTPAALAAPDPDRPAHPRFDFLPQTLAAGGEGAPDRTRLYLWLAAGALILVNLAVLVGRDMIEVSRLRSDVEAQQPVVDAVVRLRRRVEGEDARRRDLLAHGRHGDPLRVINAVTEALPDGAWVQRMEWNGQTLRLVGFKRSDIDLSAAIRGTGLFTNPRAAGPETTPGPTAVRPFDITADARPEPRP